MNLSPIQREVYNFIQDNPSTAEEIAERMGYSSTSTVYDHIAAIRDAGIIVGLTKDNEYKLVRRVDVTANNPNDLKNVRLQ